MQVLVVDDDVVSRMMLMHLVDACAPAAGCSILEAEDGEQAWALLAGGLRPAIVFSDLRMPHLGGLELLARLRADPAPDLAATPFVLVSAASDADTLAQAARLGADGCLSKPFTHAQVLAQLAPVRGDADEHPQAVAQRLGIPPERLLVYLDGLERQLEAARGQATPALAQLAQGCATLGLAGSAARLHAAGEGMATRDAIGQALAALRRQRARARAAAPDSPQ